MCKKIYNNGKASIFFIILFLLLPGLLYCQRPLKLAISNHTLIATDSLQPFWFVSGQHGKFAAAGSFANLTDLYLGMNHDESAFKAFSYSWGVNGVALFSKNNEFNLNRLFASVAWKGWELKTGTFYDPVLYGGLSTTNGNLARSGNSRPVPTIRFSTLGYKKLPFWQNWLSFKFEYDEGFLNDKRFVTNAHLHHKSLYGKFRLTQTVWFTAGLEHYVMWGGTSPIYGQLPDGWDDYWRYVFALPGDDDFLATDQLNSSGNQMGTFQFEFEKQFAGWNLTAYLSHPFEDNSGLNWKNWPDNLLGVYINMKSEKGFITDVVVEYTNTRQQSINDSIYRFDEASGQWKMKEYDNYYNHGIYGSGFTYHQLPLSSPLFYPVNRQQGISMGIQSNRFYSVHTGIKGYLADHLAWKSMLTFVRHLGTYSVPYSETHTIYSGLLEINYKNPEFPVEIGLSTALDIDNDSGKNGGLQIRVAKTW
jgi:hypothetical protein